MTEMSFTLAITFLTWEHGLFWGEPDRHLHIIQGKIIVLGLGFNIDLAIL